MFDNFKRKAMALLLSLAMIITYMPASMIAYAEGVDDQVQVEQQAEAEAPAEDVEAPKAEQPEEKAPAEDVEAPKAEQPEEKASEEVKSEEAAPVEKKASEASEDAAKPADEEVKEDAKAKVEDKEPIVYTEDLETVAVKVTAPADAFSEKVKLVVKPLEKNSDEFKEAEEALAENKQTYDGILAFDIHFEDSKGKEVEPDGAVSVEMTAKKEALKGVDPKAIDENSIQVTHIGSDETTVVADNADKAVEGTVEVQSTKKAVEQIDAEFEVDGFSTYTITWTEGGDEKSATIHWGTMGAGGFEPFDSTTTVDYTASSVDLAVNVDGYYYAGAQYKASETAKALTMTSSTIRKDANGVWTAEVDPVPDDDIDSEQTVPLGNGSDIYVIYASKGGGGYNPPGPPPATLDNIKPVTKKSVVPNRDGTYNIRLDVTGHATEDTKQGANVIVMLDMTYSMRQTDMNGTRIAAAKSALLTLIDALDPGYDAQHPDLNLVNFSLATFGNTMDTTTVRTWTQNRAQMESAVNGLSNSPGALGTNWQGGLGGAETLAEAANRNPDLNKNPTYVIFVTDGAPNCWQGHTSSDTGNDLDPLALPYAQTAANSLTQDAILYGVFCGPAGGFNNLADMVTNAHGAATINGTNQTDLQAAFSQIAGHIVEGMAAGNVTVDDGIPSLSSVSASVTAGEAGSFKYYIKPAGGAEKPWDKGTLGDNDPGAPGATYDKTNGVTWDLGEVGTLQEGWVYSVEFTVWPSQEAYDTIADLNNGIKTMTDAELKAAGIKKELNEDGETYSYSLMTNTHLNTTFEDPTGHVYDVVQQDVVSEAMALPTDTISVQKIWNNILDRQDPPDGVELILERDGEDYLYGEHAIKVSKPSWEVDDIYISVGQIRGTGADYEILETGHDYEIVEVADYEGNYRWELTSEIYHPMVINGVNTMLIRDDSAEGDDGTDYYTFGKGEDTHKYVVSDAEANKLKAWNDRRSWLQIGKKVTGEGAPTDALFEFTATITDANGEDVWYSAYGPDGIITNLDTNGTPEEGNTGYYHAASGSQITAKIKAGWTLRFINLPSGTTYEIDETGLPDGFAFEKAEDNQVIDTAAGVEQDDPEEAEIEGSVASGNINVPNVEFYVDYTNKYEEIDIEFTKAWDDGNDQDGKRPSAAEFANYISLLVNGTASKAYDGKRTITVKDNNTYTIKYTGVPKYINGEEAEYQLSESVIEGYTTTGNPAKVNGTITNKHEPETVDIPATKTFADTTVVGVLKIVEVGLTLQQLVGNDWVPVENQIDKRAKVGDDGKFRYTFEDLPKYTTDAAGVATLIVYRVIENAVYVEGKDGGDPVNIKDQLGLGEDEEAFVASPGTSDNDYTLQNTRNKGNLIIKKVVVGDNVMPDTAEFTITGPNDFTPVTVKYSEFNDKPNNQHKLNNIPTGKYTVTESGADATGYSVVTTYSPAGPADAEGNVTRAVVTVTTKTDAQVTVTNTYEANPVDIQAEKIWVDNNNSTRTRPKSVTFELYKAPAGDTSEQPETTGYTVTLDGTKDTDVPEKGGYESAAWKATFKNMPGYEDGEELKYTVKETGTSTGKLPGKEGSGATYTVSYSDDGLTVTNKLDTTEAEIKVTKEFTGREWTTDDRFTFTLASTDNAPMPAANEVTITKDDAPNYTKTFGNILYDHPGTYRYTIKESVPSDTKGITYDSGNAAIGHTVTVVVSDDLKATVTYDENKSSLTVVNTYKAEPTEAELKAKKTLSGRTLNADEFTFELKDSEGKVIQSKKNAADGSVTFEAIEYENAGTYNYTITEVIPADADKLGGVTYDTTEHKAVVTVRDNLDGTMTATVKYMVGDEEETLPEFKNVYKAEPTEAGLKAKKTLSGRALKADEFTFELKDSEGKVIQRKKNAADGSVTFEAIEYENAGTYNYTITEKVPEGADEDNVFKGVKYDTTVHNAEVKVVDNLDGTMTATVKYMVGDEEETLPEFKNVYKATGKTVINAKKNLTGRQNPATAKPGEFTFTLTGTDGTSDTKTNDADSKVTFKELTYSEQDLIAEDGSYLDEKEYEYTISEAVPEDADENNVYKGVKYDTTPKKLTVKISDNGDGTLKVEKSTAGEETDAVFNNTYEATGELDFSGLKILEHGNLADQEFTFELVQVTKNLFSESEARIGEPVTVGGSTYTEEYVAGSETSAEFAFDKITFTLNADNNPCGKPYKYRIRELVPEDAVNAAGTKYKDASKEEKAAGGFIKGYYEYGSHEKEITVTVEDKGDGTLIITKDPEAGDYDVTFVNCKKYTDLEITKKVNTFVETNAKEVTLAFEITGGKNADGTDFRAAAGLTFTEDEVKAGTQKNVTVYRVPTDAVITVREVYASNFEPEPGSNPQIAELNEDGVYTVSFKNSYNNIIYNTGAINKYTQKEGGGYDPPGTETPAVRGDGQGDRKQN